MAAALAAACGAEPNGVADKRERVLSYLRSLPKRQEKRLIVRQQCSWWLLQPGAESRKAYWRLRRERAAQLMAGGKVERRDGGRSLADWSGTFLAESAHCPQQIC